MNREDIRKLLGGYATGTLTPEEQQALFEAALGDQELFDALVREQALHDLLRDPAAKAQLLTALDERPPRWYEAFQGWRAAAAIGMAALVVAAVVIVRQNRLAPRPLEVAMVKAPEPPAAPPAPTPAAPAATAVPAAVAGKPKAAPRQFTPPRTDLRREAPAHQPELPPAPKAEMAPPPPVPPLEIAAPPAPLAAARGMAGGIGGTIPGTGQNARGLFYGNLPVSRFAATDATGQAGQQQGAQGQQQESLRMRAAAAGGRGGGGGAAMPARNLGVRYTVLRKSETGDYVEIDPDNLKAGDSVELRFTTNDSGTLSLMARTAPSAWRLVATRRMERLVPFTTEPLRPGEKDLQVSFSRQPEAVLQNAALSDAALSKDSSNLTEQAAAERATYVVNPAAPEVRFAITLSFK